MSRNTIAWCIPMRVTWINTRFSPRVRRSIPLEIGESRVAGGFCKRFPLRRERIWERKRGEENRGWPGNTAGLDVWDCVCDSLFALTSRWTSRSEVPPTSLSSRSPPAVLASNVCSWHTTCVFARVLGLRWIDSGGEGDQGSPFDFSIPSPFERRERATSRMSSSSTRIGAKGSDARSAAGIYFYKLCRRDWAASSLMFEPTHRH